uniref:CCA tRNA nucleotidyltransferase n=1 Tax=uncultured Enorma sp. TaxID=1714346 RepID=UPI002803F175
MEAANELRAVVASPALNGAHPTPAALRVLSVLEGAGLEAWIVGGWVRDALLGAPNHDIDVCCSGLWQESARVLRAAGIDVVESGTKFGGITAVVDGERIEVTTYRLDGFYTDGRHPESVERAASVEEDLARRDFTVNAMAWHPARGLLDCFDGAGDLERREIRAVGEPQRRFEEDALRMLRAVRFACRLDFTIEPATAAALASCAPLLDAVARERVG